MLLRKITKHPCLILGFGREGQSTYRFLRKISPTLSIGIADQNENVGLPKDQLITSHLGPSYLQAVHEYQTIIKTPGISPHLPEIVAAKKQAKLITSQTQIFLEICPGRIIGITGTKGKSTTTSLIYHVLHENHIPSVLIGNIGKPVLDYLNEGGKNTYFVFEMSCHQLMDATRSPNIAVLQNILPEHLDYYTSFGEYVRAKQNIALYQTPKDYFIYNADFPLPRRTAKLTKARIIPFSKKGFDPKIKTKLLGEYNKYNILPSVIIGNLLELTTDQIYSTIATFEPLDHRLQLVGSFKGIDFYDAALSTIPEATIAAIDALGKSVSTLITGGHERKQDYKILAKKIINSNIRTVILLPATGERIWKEVKKLPTRNPVQHFLVDSMQKAIKMAYNNTSPGKICLLAPAAPSFTIFKDYVDEAEQYKKYILELSTAPALPNFCTQS